MNYETQIKEWITADGERMDALEYASTLDLDDWCLAAGFVRNLVWDNVHGKSIPTLLNDIDLIYFNTNNCNAESDRNYESSLKLISDFPWSVKNQARMHIRNNDSPYFSTCDAMSHWVEVETAIGVKLSNDHELELVAPFGLKALFSNTVTINSKRRKPEDFEQRITSKKWLERWPNLRVHA